MKKLVLISSLLLLGGCKESNTGLDKMFLIHRMTSVLST